MLIVGLLLIVLAVAAVLAAVFATDASELTYLGFDVGPLTVYLIGAGTVVALVLGARLTGVGARRDLRRRRESRRLARVAQDRERARQDHEQDPVDEP